MTLIYETIIAIPAIIIAGPILSKGLKKVDARPVEEFMRAPAASPGNLPGFWTSVVSSLLPVLLIGAATIASNALPGGNAVRTVLGWVVNPPIAMLVSLLLAIYTLGVARGRTMTDVMASLTHRFRA